MGKIETPYSVIQRQRVERLEKVAGQVKNFSRGFFMTLKDICDPFAYRSNKPRYQPSETIEQWGQNLALVTIAGTAASLAGYSLYLTFSSSSH